MKIVVGQGSCGIAAGAEKVYNAIHNLIGKGELNAELSITGCIGMCYLEPIVDVYTENSLRRYVRVNEKDAPGFVNALKSMNFEDSALVKLEIKPEDKEILNKQTRIALRNCGYINPESIEEYELNGGYSALKKVLLNMTAEDVINEIKEIRASRKRWRWFPDLV